MNPTLFSTNFTQPIEGDEFLVISGSITHIQKFIYDTKSQGALKNLRGRSFFLSLLSRAISDKLLYELELQRNTVLYNSGGTFCIIAPSSTSRSSKIDDVIKKIKRAVVEMLHIDIVNINYINASLDELNADCARIFARLFKKKHQSKFMPYSADTDYDSLFCATDRKMSNSYEQIGGSLCNITGILVSRERLESSNALCVDMHKIGTYFYLGNAAELATIKAGEGAYMLLINGENQPKDCNIPTYCEFIAGNGARVNSFEELFSQDDSSHRRLAVLRMDVDNLGLLLQSKMSQANPLSKYALFSHQLDKYFKESINEMWTRKYSDSTVIIYAGGDDLFVVGEWENTLKFAAEINQNFRMFFINEDMGISGGVSLVESKYPIIRAAEMSAEEEGLAKSFNFKDCNKNSISIFGTPLRWNYEFELIDKYYNNLYQLIKCGAIDKSFVQHILQISKNVRFENGKITPVRYVWLAVYDLSRMAKRMDTKNNGAKFIEQCIKDIMSGRTFDGLVIDSPYHSLQLITIAARLVEMKLWKTN